jgi:hypothetical protein
VFLSRSGRPAWWDDNVAAAEEYVRTKMDNQKHQTVTGERRQWKFGRDLNKFPGCVLQLIRSFEADVFKLCGTEDICVHDCYAVATLGGDETELARGPQPWHLDSFFSFPTVTCLLSGSEMTEFAAGTYTDFSEEFHKAQDKGFQWHLNAHGRFCKGNVTFGYNFDSTSYVQSSATPEEQLHWQNHLTRAGLLPDAKVEAAEIGTTSGGTTAGDACVFWANKAHRGPATTRGSQRIVLFVNWVPLNISIGKGSLTHNTWSLDPHAYQKHQKVRGRGGRRE